METDGLFPAPPSSAPTPVLQMCRDPSLLLAREECSAPRVAGSSPTAWLSNLNHLAECGEKQPRGYARPGSLSHKSHWARAEEGWGEGMRGWGDGWAGPQGTENLEHSACPQIHSFFLMCHSQGLMGFVGLIGEPGIVGEKVSEGAGDKPSELVHFNQERQGPVGLGAAGSTSLWNPMFSKNYVPVSVPHVPVS